MIKLVEHTLGDVLLQQGDTKSADGGEVGHVIDIKRESDKAHERKPVSHVIFHGGVAEVVPTLHEQNLEHGQSRLGRIADGVDVAANLFVQKILDRLPVYEAVDLVEKGVLAPAAVSDDVIGNAGIVLRLLMIATAHAAVRSLNRHGET